MSILDYIKGHLELPYRPFRVGADAAAILTNATRAVKHILDQRAALDRNGLHHVPLVVGNGEDHFMISNKVHHMLVISEVMKRENIAVAFENFHDYFFRKLDKSGYSDSVEKIKAMDIEEGGALSLKANVFMNLDHRTPFANFTFKHMLLRHKIKTCFCDVAGSGDPYFSIDKADPSSLESLRFFFGNELPDLVDMRHGDGLAVRNHHMAQMTKDFAAKCGSRIVFLMAGDGHIIGWEGEDFESKNGTKFLGKDLGLNYFFRQLSMPFVGLVLNDVREFRKGAEHKDDAIFAGKGMPQILVSYNPLTGRPRQEFVTSDIRSEAAEVTYLNALLSRTGLASEAVTPESKQKIQEEYKRDLSLAINRASGLTMPEPG